MMKRVLSVLICFVLALTSVTGVALLPYLSSCFAVSDIQTVVPSFITESNCPISELEACESTINETLREEACERLNSSNIEAVAADCFSSADCYCANLFVESILGNNGAPEYFDEFAACLENSTSGCDAVAGNMTAFSEANRQVNCTTAIEQIERLGFEGQGCGYTCAGFVPTVSPSVSPPASPTSGSSLNAPCLWLLVLVSVFFI